MKAKLPGHKKRREEALKVWLEIFRLVNSGEATPAEVPDRLPNNPKTGKPYSIKTIYWVLKKFERNEV